MWSSIYPSTRPARSRSLGSSNCPINLKSQVPMLPCKATSASTPKMIKRKRQPVHQYKLSPYQGPRSTTLYRQSASPDNQPNNRACLRRRSLSRPTEGASSPEVAVMPVLLSTDNPAYTPKFHNKHNRGPNDLHNLKLCFDGSIAPYHASLISRSSDC